MKIKTNSYTPITIFESSKKGEYGYVRAPKNIDFGPSNKTISLQTETILPKGLQMLFSATLQHNNVSIYRIDKGSRQEWRVFINIKKPIKLKQGDIFLKYKIVLSPNASIWTKIKWLFVKTIEFI
jgi:hypothetical protein